MADICQEISSIYTELVVFTQGVSVTIGSEDVCYNLMTVYYINGIILLQVSQKLRSNIHTVGNSTVDLLHCAVNARIAFDDDQAIKDLYHASKVLAEKVISVRAYMF